MKLPPQAAGYQRREYLFLSPLTLTLSRQGEGIKDNLTARYRELSSWFLTQLGLHANALDQQITPD